MTLLKIVSAEGGGGGGGAVPGLQNKLFRPFGPQFGLQIEKFMCKR